jgi:hypothetical protein
MSSSNLLRLAGLAALLGAVLLIIAGLAQLVLNLFFSGPVAVSEAGMGALYVRSALGLLGNALVALGLVGLYVRQSEATGILGLVSFLVTFLGMTLPMGFKWATILSLLGWALFGIVGMQAGIYPRGAAVLLIIGAAASGLFNILLVAPVVAGPGAIPLYASIGAEIIRNAGVAWLGHALFSRRGSRPRAPAREVGF